MDERTVFSELPSIGKFVFGAFAGIGLTLAVLFHIYFFGLTALAIAGYAFLMENEREKKNPPSISGDS